MDHQDPASSYLFPPQTEHYHLDWHRFNLKQRLLGRRTLPVEVFEEKTRAGEEQGCPQQRPSAVLLGLFCPGMKPPATPASSGSLYSAPVASPGGLALLLSPADLLQGEGSVLPEPCLCIPGDPESQAPISPAHNPLVICRVSDRTFLGLWAGPWSHLQSFGEAGG